MPLPPFPHESIFFSRRFLYILIDYQVKCVNLLSWTMTLTGYSISDRRYSNLETSPITFSSHELVITPYHALSHWVDVVLQLVCDYHIKISTWCQVWPHILTPVSCDVLRTDTWAFDTDDVHFSGCVVHSWIWNIYFINLTLSYWTVFTLECIILFSYEDWTGM